MSPIFFLTIRDEGSVLFFPLSRRIDVWGSWRIPLIISLIFHFFDDDPFPHLSTPWTGEALERGLFFLVGRQSVELLSLFFFEKASLFLPSG